MAERHQMVDDLVTRGFVQDPRVIRALRTVPRELFLEASARAEAYEDHPVWIGSGQTMSAPHMVAMMLEGLGLQPGHRVLEVGTGSGYHAALAGMLVEPGGRVVTIELHASLAAKARASLGNARAENVEVRVGDGGKGAPDLAPFDRIYLTCAAPRMPPPLLDQLAPDGWILAPLGDGPSRLVRARRRDDGWFEEDLGACAFVPLRGQYAEPLADAST